MHLKSNSEIRIGVLCFTHLVLQDFLAHLVSQSYPSLPLNLDGHTLGYREVLALRGVQTDLDHHLDHDHL